MISETAPGRRPLTDVPVEYLEMVRAHRQVGDAITALGVNIRIVGVERLSPSILGGLDNSLRESLSAIGAGMEALQRRVRIEGGAT